MNLIVRAVLAASIPVGLLLAAGCSIPTSSADVTCAEYNSMSMQEQGEALDAAIRANGRNPGTIVGIGVLEMGLQDRCSSTSNRYEPIAELVFGTGAEPPSEPTVDPNDAAFDQPKKKMPKNGAEVWLTISDSFKGHCQRSLDQGRKGRLRISVPNGEETYFVKLKAGEHGGPVGWLSPIFGVTIRPGKTVAVDVPLCGFADYDYHLYYGAGTTWYGYEYMFGPKGAYARADEVFPFRKGTGWEVELILQPGGNLGADGIGYDEFVG